MRHLFLMLALLTSPAILAQSAIEPREFRTDIQEKRYRALIGELRCTVCQNEALESSNAPLAADLRQQVYEMIMDGRADFEIREYMRERYGDFVLYDPPFVPRTLILYLGPGVLLLIGLITAGITIRQRRRMLHQRKQTS